MLKNILTAITGIALAFSMLAGTAGQANAATGYNSAYFGESAFLTLAPGASGQFAVGFNNTGSTGWLVGSSSQVDLSICLADKLTCNVTSPNAAFASSWLSSTAYATTSTTFVGPGQTGFFVYNITAPSAAAAGTYRFNGDLALHNTASMINQQGYYQDSDVASLVAAPTITSLTPATGTNAGGTAVVIAGTGFVCTPATPTVNFGAGNAGTVTSCGASSLSVTSPAHAVGTVSVTVNNAGGAASNGIDYVYSDTTKPTYTSVTAGGNAAIVTFSEAVCNPAAGTTAATDWTLTNNGTAIAVSSDSIPTCDATTPAGVTTATLVLATAVTNGATVIATLNITAAGINANITDLASPANPAVAPRSNSTTATAPETTAPTIASTTGTAGTSGTNAIKITFSEPVWCTGLSFNTTDFTLTDNNATTTDPTVTAAGTDVCGASAAAADTSFQLTLSGPLLAATSYTLTLTPETTEIRDVVGNDFATAATTTFTTTAADTARPLSQDIRITTNGDFDLNTTDVFTVAFNEVVVAPATAAIRLTDFDGTVANVVCGTNATCAISVVATTIGGVSYPIGQVITVTMTAGPTIVTVGATVNLQFPSTVVDSILITDTAGNTWDIAGSPDKTLS